MPIIETDFVTYHRSGKDLHVRTSNGVVLYVDHDRNALFEAVMLLKRGQKIRISGEFKMSTTLSNEVLEIDALES
ncbi:MAG TPA: hypothetical protein EYO58_11020, partial [Flavobacteriales bacterium]|nr:hypothetical protein [Flavobacteriales bacterium]